MARALRPDFNWHHCEPRRRTEHTELMRVLVSLAQEVISGLKQMRYRAELTKQPLKLKKLQHKPHRYLSMKTLRRDLHEMGGPYK